MTEEIHLVAWYPFPDYNKSVMVPGRKLIDPWVPGWPENPSPMWIAEPDAEMIDWLQHCYELLESGQESRLVPDPFFESARGEITEEMVDTLIRELDKEFIHEMSGSWNGTGTAATHYLKSGAQTTPDFHRLGSKARLALVQGLAVINEKWLQWVQEHPPEPKSEEKPNVGIDAEYGVFC